MYTNIKYLHKKSNTATCTIIITKQAFSLKRQNLIYISAMFVRYLKID